MSSTLSRYFLSHPIAIILNPCLYFRTMKTRQAIKHFGSIKLLARALAIKPPSVYQWGDQPPKQRQYELERITKGKLKAKRK